MADEEWLVDGYTFDSRQGLIGPVLGGPVDEEKWRAVRDPPHDLVDIDVGLAHRGVVGHGYFPLFRSGRPFGGAGEPGRVSKPACQGPRRQACPGLARGNVLQNAAPGREPGAGPDMDMIPHARAPSAHNSISDHRGARYSRMRRKNAVSPNDHIVRDLDQIIDLGVFTDHRIFKGAPVDTAVRAYSDAVLNNHTAQLGKINQAPRSEGRAKTRLADDRAGVDPHAITDKRKTDDSARADQAVPADADAGPHYSARPDARAAPQVGMGADNGVRREDHIILKRGTWMHMTVVRAMTQGTVEAQRGLGVGRRGRRRDDRDAAGRQTRHIV